MLQEDKLNQTTEILVGAIQKLTDLWSSNSAREVAAEVPEVVVAPAAADHRQTVYCYLVGCGGLSAAARRNGGRSRYKIGTTTYTNLNDRLAEIGRDRYAAAVKVGNTFQIESGYEAWVALMIRTSRAPRDARITLLPRTIKVELPSTITRRSFDEALHRKLKARSLGESEPLRFTITYEGEAQVVRKAREIYVFSPLEDGDELLRAVEEILYSSPARVRRRRNRTS